MNSAIIQFRSNIAYVRNLNALHASLATLITGALDLTDLLRTQIVMSASALDHYVHEVTRIGMIRILEGVRPQTPAFLRFSVSLQAALDGVSTGGTTAWLENEVRNRHGFLAFQQPEKMPMLSGWYLRWSCGAKLGIVWLFLREM